MIRRNSWLLHDVIYGGKWNANQILQKLIFCQKILHLIFMEFTFDSTLLSRFETFSRVEYSREISLESRKVFAYIFFTTFLPRNYFFTKLFMCLWVKCNESVENFRRHAFNYSCAENND